MDQQTLAHQQVDSTGAMKVLRNTYMLLAMTLAFSAITAGISMSLGLGHGAALIMSIAALAIIWFVIPRVANSAMGLPVVFLFTGLLGASLGPILNRYLAMQGGTEIVMQALGGTAIIFLSLSAYVNTTKKDFSFMGGFLATGIILAFIGSIGALVASMVFGIDVKIFSLVISGAFALLMSGLILYQTSEIIHGGETNYILATVTLYVAVYNLFTSLLHILGFMNED